MIGTFLTSMRRFTEIKLAFTGTALIVGTWLLLEGKISGGEWVTFSLGDIGLFCGVEFLDKNSKRKYDADCAS